MIQLVITLLFLNQILGDSIMTGVPIKRNFYGSDIQNSKYVHMYPWLISILDGNTRKCSGSIISINAILTSAKCTMDPVETLSVWVALSIAKQEGLKHSITSVKRHEKFLESDGIITNDIAFVTVSPSFQFSEHVSKIGLSIIDSDLAPNSAAIVTSWGIDSLEGNKTGHWYHMKISSILTVEDTECSKNLGFPGWRMTGHICAVLFGDNVCSADSGGPIIKNGFQIGIVSWTDTCYDNNPRIHISISNYRDWIDDNLKKI